MTLQIPWLSIKRTHWRRSLSQRRIKNPFRHLWCRFFAKIVNGLSTGFQKTPFSIAIFFIYLPKNVRRSSALSSLTFFIYHRFPFTRSNYAHLLCYIFTYLIRFNAYDNEFLAAASWKLKEWKRCCRKSLFLCLWVKCLKNATRQQTLKRAVSQDCTCFL